MKQFFSFVLGNIIVAIVILKALPDWIPTKDAIKGCLVTTMYKVELCPTSSNYVPLAKISSYLQKTIILTEDSSFFTHHGFDWESIEKNAKEGWETGIFKRGGSTITQQLAKNMFLSQERTFLRKGLEALITDRIENTLTKKEILERYLNVVEFGKNIYGVKAAAKFYFHKKPDQLDIVESAFLAMVLPNPVKYSSSYYRKELTPFARNRLSNIVESLYRYNRITQEEYNIAINQVANFFHPQPTAEDLSVSGSEDLSDETGETSQSLEEELDQDLQQKQIHESDSERQHEDQNTQEENL
ncbi:MAG: transglycosylase domain-containing protein [Bdellovibrio sp.]